MNSGTRWSRSRSRCVRGGFVVLWVAASVSAETRARADGCAEGISEGNATRLYNAMVKASAPGSCTLEDVRTDDTVTRLVWAKGAWTQEEVFVTPTSCTRTVDVRGPVLSAVVPRSVADDCPAQVAALRTLLTGDTFDPLVSLKAPVPLPPLASRPWVMGHSRLVAGLIAVVAGLLASAYLWKTRRLRA